MSAFFMSLPTNAIKYLADNLSCLSYAGDVVVSKYLIYTSYYDLLVDISEGFGVWVAITVLILALSSLSVMIHDTELPTTTLSSSKVGLKKSNVANLLTYSSFVRFMGSLKTRL